MQKRTDKLDLISIKAHCPKSWEEMTGNETRRFCSQCQRDVHNLSALTRQEANQLLTQTSSRLCVRTEQDEQGNVLTREMLVPPSLLNRFLSHLVLAGLSLASFVLPAQASQSLGISSVIAQCKTKVAANKRRKTSKRPPINTLMGDIAFIPVSPPPKPVLITPKFPIQPNPTVDEIPPPPKPKDN